MQRIKTSYPNESKQVECHELKQVKALNRRLLTSIFCSLYKVPQLFL
jgi:hypothetical protein